MQEFLSSVFQVVGQHALVGHNQPWNSEYKREKKSKYQSADPRHTKSLLINTYSICYIYSILYSYNNIEKIKCYLKIIRTETTFTVVYSIYPKRKA